MSEGLLIVLGGVAVFAVIMIEKSLKTPDQPQGGGTSQNPGNNTNPGNNSGNGNNGNGGGSTPPNMVPLPFENAPVPPVAGAYPCPKFANSGFGMYFVPQQPWNGSTNDLLVSDKRFSPYDDNATPLTFGGFKYWVRQLADPNICGSKP
jgi:hypothetical protein